MPISQFKQIQNFLPAVVKSTPATGICVEYYVLDPVADEMVRKRLLLNRYTKRIPRKRDRLLAAQQIADNLNAKLRGGWSPLHETEDVRLYTRLADLQSKFLAAKNAEGCRPTTLVQYKSVIDLWLRWCEDNGMADRYSGTYLRAHAVRYMDAVLEQGHRHRTYNNTMKVMKAFFQWAVEHLYAKENPFVGFKPLKKEKKIRNLVPPDVRRMVAEYYATVRPAMNIVCQLVYSSAIRPTEIHKIQLKHIRLDRHYIVIPSENSKNYKERCATLTPPLVDMLSPVLEKYDNPELFLFGDNKELHPDKKPCTKSYFHKSWMRMRRNLGLPLEMQLYSLRDTGLTDLLHSGVDQLTVQHHADHSSLDIQNIYTDHFDPLLNDRIYNNAPRF